MPTPDLLQSLDTRRSTPSRQLGPPGPDDATLLRKYKGCSYASGSLEVSKHAIVMSSGTFNALDVSGVAA